MSASPYRPSIRNSQNFLTDPALVSRVLDRCAIDAGDIVYEIGPGKGILTAQLARRCRRVVAIEKDPHLTDQLRLRFADDPHVTIYQGDFLDFRLPCTPYKVVANIPFNITATIVSKLTATACPPEDAYLAMQREAANTLLGTPRMSLRSVLLQPWFELELVHRFRRGDFAPAPRVDVVMLRLRKRGPPLVSHTDAQCFRDFVTHIFTAWRPRLESTLNRLLTRNQLSYVSDALGVDLDATPTSLTFEQWLNLFAYFKTVRNDRALGLIAGSAQHLLRRQRRLQKEHRTRARGRTRW
jgi:23S rRNA (adenine-N6)-dimethyltransferase